MSERMGEDLSSRPGNHSLGDPRRITAQAGETEQTPLGALVQLGLTGFSASYTVLTISKSSSGSILLQGTWSSPGNPIQ